MRPHRTAFPPNEKEPSEDDASVLEDLIESPLPADAERLIAASLALMTGFYRCPHTVLCRRLLDHLALLARHPGISEPLRTVCRNAGIRWAAYLEEVEQAVASAGEPDCNEADGEEEAEADAPTVKTLH